uniref:Uncharacterized protein n=1 Tax=Siphoviridae sp. ctKeG8 TaxID=2825443 RepID=A0A8S5PCY9_9CAUD|nr:MAG TPA: hypothetical protein [Siphoviridae sp. ctKeG8]DAV53917.1 MAG TPA: hypothetical protein [Caudoviricetes sp.]
MIMTHQSLMYVLGIYPLAVSLSNLSGDGQPQGIFHL